MKNIKITLIICLLIFTLFLFICNVRDVYLLFLLIMNH